MNKKSSGVPQTGTQENDAAQGLSGPPGLRWLKYSGIGPNRVRDGGPKKLSADEITSLGSLEAEVMGVLWEIDAPATSMDVSEQLLYKRRAAGNEPASFATVNTTLRRLADKGLVVGEKNENRTPLYVPTVPREEMAARILNNVSETLLGHTLHGLLPKLLGNIRPAKKGEQDSNEEATIERFLKALEQAADERQQMVDRNK